MSVAEKKTTWIPEKWQIGEQESMYAQMSAEGWHLEALLGEKASFVKGEPMQYKYRVDFGQFVDIIELQIESRKALYAQSGWEFVCSVWNMGVFRSNEAENAPEIHTDLTELAIVVRKMKNRLIAFTLALVAIILGPRIIAIKNGIMPLIHWTALFMHIVLIHRFIRESVATSKLAAFLRMGGSYNHDGNWQLATQKKKRYYQLCTTIIILLCIPMIYDSIITIVNLTKR
ncbi:MAG: DUF2812 domain-containing protein [Oscillospiraceae bacterium]|nr:DUF2812 domain-containing protein [Oscillospiraceae bacterium]